MLALPFLQPALPTPAPLPVGWPGADLWDMWVDTHSQSHPPFPALFLLLITVIGSSSWLLIVGLFLT
jgi:hypothetical protein